MSRDEALQALREACAERIKKQFGVLADNMLAESPDTAKQQFHNACANDIQALSIAESVVDQMFRG